MVKAATSELVSFDQDFHAWVLEQIELLKNGRFSDLDIEHLTDELRAIAMAEESEIESRLVVLLQHLLKWEFQSERRSNSWRATILEQRTRINRVISRSPSLRHYPATVIAKEYRIARLHASGETGMPVGRFPSGCPYSVAQVLDENFFPGGRAGFED
jgi:Domain of unknown function DUF29